MRAMSVPSVVPTALLEKIGPSFIISTLYPCLFNWLVFNLTCYSLILYLVFKFNIITIWKFNDTNNFYFNIIDGEIQKQKERFNIQSSLLIQRRHTTEYNNIRMARGQFKEFPITINLHRKSILNLYLFALIMNELTKNI